MVVAAELNMTSSLAFPLPVNRLFEVTPIVAPAVLAKAPELRVRSKAPATPPVPAWSRAFTVVGAVSGAAVNVGQDGLGPAVGRLRVAQGRSGAGKAEVADLLLSVQAAGGPGEADERAGPDDPHVDGDGIRVGVGPLGHRDGHVRAVIVDDEISGRGRARDDGRAVGDDRRRVAVVAVNDRRAAAGAVAAADGVGAENVELHA